MNTAILIPVVVIVFLMLINAPIWAALFGGMITYFMFLKADLPAKILIQRFVATTESSSYLAVPFFITAGAIMNRAGLSEKMLDFADALVGHLRGGLAHVNILLSVVRGAPARICSTTSVFEPRSLSGYISKLRSPFVRSVISLYASVMYFTQRPLEDWVVATLKVMGLSISFAGAASAEAAVLSAAAGVSAVPQAQRENTRTSAVSNAMIFFIFLFLLF